MVHFDNFTNKMQDAVTACLQATQQQQQPAQLDGIKELATTHVGPYAGSENALAIELGEGRTDWRRGALEVVFRRKALDLVRSLPEDNDEHFVQIYNCLDLSLACTELDYLDAIIPLTLIEEVLDAHSLEGCERIFSYLEKRKEKLIANMIPGKGKALVLLRTCNELLRRLSKERNTVFCGRILMFLANSFPLCERSGVNVRGEFNTELVHYDADEEVDADPDMTEEQKTFYKRFWSTRKYYSDPPQIFQNDNFKELQEGLNAVLDKFTDIMEREQAMEGAPKPENVEHVGMKRQRSSSSPMNVDKDAAEQMLDEINQEYHFPRLLSSRRLLDLQIEDIRFRRNVIIQTLTLLQYLNGFAEKEKERTQKILSEQGKKHSLTVPAFTLEGDQLSWVVQTRSKMLKLLRAIKPDGEVYTNIVLRLLHHEYNWILWKASGCPDFEKPPLSGKVLSDLVNTKRPRTQASLNTYRFSYGNPEMTAMYGTERTPLAKVMQSRARAPEPLQVIDTALAEVKAADSIQEKYNIANGALFHATRMMLNQCPVLVPKLYSAKREAWKAIKEKPTTEANGTSTGTATGAAGDHATQAHVDVEVQVLEKARQLIRGDPAP